MKNVFSFIVVFLGLFLNETFLPAQERNVVLGGDIETITVSDLYTTHLIFPTDIIYADISDPNNIVAKLIQESKNTVAIKAKKEFSTTSNISMMESNGIFHTYLIRYQRQPERLVIDCRQGASAHAGEGGQSSGAGISRLRKTDAPSLSEILEYPRELYHLTTKYLKVQLSCENIYAYSDITYLTLGIVNKSGVSYEAKEVIFTVEEEGGRSKTKIRPEPISVLPKSTLGSLTVAPGESSRMAFALEKKALSRTQRLKVYLYEVGGQRNLVLTLSPEDINLAKVPRE